MSLQAFVGREVYIGYVFYQGNWWAWFDNQWLGYFPGSEWGGSYTQSSLIQWFGEVATDNGIPPNVQMGNGLFPTDPSAASMATLCDVDAPAWVCWYRDLQSLGPTYPPYYDIRRTGFGVTRYGGPGL
jgi:neprosin-like protein